MGRWWDESLSDYIGRWKIRVGGVVRRGNPGRGVVLRPFGGRPASARQPASRAVCTQRCFLNTEQCWVAVALMYENGAWWCVPSVFQLDRDPGGFPSKTSSPLLFGPQLCFICALSPSHSLTFSARSFSQRSPNLHRRHMLDCA